MNWEDFEESDSLASMLHTGAIYDERPIKIAHISDPHFTGRRRPGLVEGLCRRIGIYGHEPDTWEAIPAILRDGERPDILVISGDLTAFGTPSSLRHAKTRVLELAGAWNVPEDKVFVIPGNHDRFLGYVGHVINPLFSKFEDVFKGLYRSAVVEVNGKRVMIYSFDSTEEGFRLWPFFANTGRVKKSEFNEFNDRIKILVDENAIDVLVVLLHHHPLPIPNAKTEGLTIMKNGGAFMAHMQNTSVDLVLHGHMHHCYSCRINYSEDSPDTLIVAAGTACQGGKETCSISLIDFHPARRAAIRVYSYKETGFSLDANHGRVYRLQL